VVLELDGQAFALAPEHARTLARALITSAAKAEEANRVQDVIRDQAFLMRVGIPISLSKDQRVLDEAKKEAVNDRDLRRYLPKTPSKVLLGSPTIIQHPPRED
jgi:hypothetical protein